MATNPTTAESCSAFSEPYPLPPEQSQPGVKVEENFIQGEIDPIVEQVAAIRYASGHVVLKRQGTSEGRERALGPRRGSLKVEIFANVEALIEDDLCHGSWSQRQPNL